MGLLSKVFKVVKKALGFDLLKKALDWLIDIDVDNGTRAIQVMREGSNNDIPVIYGEQLVGGVVVHKYVTDQSGGAKNDTLNLIVAFAEGEIESIDTLYFDDVPETDPKFGGVVSNLGFDFEYEWLRINKHTGVDGQAADADAVANIPNWTNEHKMSGLAYCFIQLIMDKKQEVWRGEPSITAKIKGKKILDTRSGLTELSSNPAMCLRDYLTNTLYGKGISESRIDEQAFITAADFCDEGVTVTETLTKSFYDDELKEYINLPASETTKEIQRFSCNLIVDTGNQVIDNVKTILGSFRGILPPDYILSPRIERESDTLETFTIDDIIGSVEYSSGSINSRYNRVSVKYLSSLSNYETEEAFYPALSSDIYQTWLEEDGGRELEKTFTFNSINNKAEALQMAEVIAKRSRFNASASITVQAHGIKMQVGDVIGVDNETMGWDNKPFRIGDKVLSPEGEVQFSLAEHENSVYPWANVSYEDREGGTYLGDPSYIDAPINLALTPDLTLASTGQLTWDDVIENRFIEKYRLIITRTSDSAEILSDDTRGRSYTVPLLDAGNYTFSVYSVATLGNISAPATLNTTLSTPVTATDLNLVASDFEITSTPTLLGIGLGTLFEFDFIDTDSATGYEPESKGRGISFTATGLNPETNYTIYCRTVNALGTSDWISETISTTATGEQLDVFLDPIWAALNQTNTNVDDLVSDIEENISNIEIIENTINSTLRPQLNAEILRREDTDRELFNTTASLAEFRRVTNEFEDTITNAVFEVDPSNGQLNLRAYQYTDTQFTQASVLIDGVSAEVSINASKIVDLGDAVTDANSEINVLAGQIELKASYTEMEEYVSGALDAIIPAYSFGFFNSTEGWTAFRGTLTSGTNMAVATWGDIENQSLSYSADENPVITLTTRRTAGGGHNGDLVVTFSGGSTQTYTGVIDDSAIGATNVKNLNLAEEPAYTGTVTGLRIVLGDSVADEYEIDSITIGKPSAQLEALDGITAQVNELGIEVDAINGQLSSFVTTTYYDENTVTLNNVTQVLDGEEAIISLKATQTELDDQGTVSKANSASTWIDGANATIRDQVISFNAEDGSIDDQITGLTGSLNSVEQELSTIDGASIRSQLVSINRLEIESEDLAELQFYTELKLLDQRNKDLELGDSVALANQSIEAVTNEQGALAQSVIDLQASSGTLEGQVNANAQQILTAQTDIEGNAQAIATLNVSVESAEGDIATAQQQIQTISDEQGVQAQAITELETQTETIEGQVTVNATEIASVRADVDGNFQSIIGLQTSVSNVEGELTDAQLLLDSTVDELGNVASRAYLGVSDIVDGKREITGVTFDSSDNGLRFKGDIFELATNNDETALYYNSVNDTWIFTGSVVIGGSVVSTPEDLKNVTSSNLARSEGEWVVGTSGSQGGFIQYGSEFNNEVRNIEGPDGVVEPVWVSEGTQSAAAGGWSKTVTGDSTKSYRYSVWAYRRSESDSRLYFGCQDALNLDLSVNDNPYFNSDVNLPDGYKWYLLVGVVHGNNGSTATNTNTSGVYDHETGDRLQGFSEFVNDSASSTLLHRVYRREAANYYDTRFARPRIDLIDGNEPSIAELIGRTPLDGQSGAGFYGSTYSAISWTTATANSRFSALVGRDPVELDIFTQTRIDGTDSQARQYVGGAWVTVALQVNGSIVAKGTVAGDRLIAGTEISAPRIVGGDVIGSKVATAEGTATRVELEDDGTYMQWIGAGAKTDSNAIFFVKKDGTGFIKGSFFAGQIIETKFNQGTTSATITHNSAGNDVELTVGSNGSATVIAGSAPSGVGASTYTLPYTVKRGATTLESGNVIVTRVVEYEPAESEYTTRDYYNFSTTVVDTGTASAAYVYTVTVGSMPLSTSAQKTNIRSYEDLLTS